MQLMQGGAKAEQLEDLAEESEQYMWGGERLQKPLPLPFLLPVATAEPRRASMPCERGGCVCCGLSQDLARASQSKSN